MARLPKNAIREFEDLYKKEYGIKLTDEQAEEIGESLLHLMCMVYEGKPHIGRSQELKRRREMPGKKSFPTKTKQ